MYLNFNQFIQNRFFKKFYRLNTRLSALNSNLLVYGDVLTMFWVIKFTRKKKIPTESEISKVEAST
jgi:hypothetical protein